MRRHRLFKKLPTPQKLLESRILKPFQPYLHHHYLWQFNRRTVAGGVAVGLFFGILIPFAQIVLSALAAVVLRVNLPVAAVSTLVSNPFTFPALYYAAYQLGDLLTGSRSIVPQVAIESDIQKAVEVQQQVTGWFPHLVEWLQTVGLPLAVGLSVLAIGSAIAGYFAVDWIWRWHATHRWRTRRHLSPDRKSG